MPDADDALVTRSRSGDRVAFEELVRRSARLIFSRLYLETGDAHRAEDLTQETFLLAWRSIRQLDEATGAGFRAWLMSIAHRVLVDSIRRDSRKKRHGKHDDPAALAEVKDASPAPPEGLERADDRERVLSILRSLPAEYREVLTLRYIAGADYETIGRQLAISNGSLRGLLNRGLAMLREQMREPSSSSLSPPRGEGWGEGNERDSRAGNDSKPEPRSNPSPPPSPRDGGREEGA